MCEKSAVVTKISEEGGGRGALGTGAEIPLQTMEKTMLKLLVPLQHMEDHTRADMNTVEDPIPQEMIVPVENPWWSSILAGTVAHVGPTLKESVLDGLYPMERIHAAATQGTAACRRDSSWSSS